MDPLGASVELEGRTESAWALGASWRAWSRLVRLDRTLAAAAYVLVGAYLGAGTAGTWDPDVAAAGLVVGLVVAFGFALNDWCDVRVDALQRPERPLPSGCIPPRMALGAAGALAACAVIVAGRLGPLMVAFAAATIALSAAYSLRLKNTALAGNAAMGLLVSSIPVYGALAAGGLTADAVAAACLTFPYFFAQEILYTVEDHRGDLAAGLRTTSTRLGPRRSVRLAQALLAAYAVAVVVPWGIGIADDRYLIASAVCSLAPAFVVIVLLARRCDAATVRLSVIMTRAIWLSSVVPVVMLR